MDPITVARRVARVLPEVGVSAPRNNRRQQGESRTTFGLLTRIRARFSGEALQYIVSQVKKHKGKLVVVAVCGVLVIIFAPQISSAFAAVRAALTVETATACLGNFVTKIAQLGSQVIGVVPSYTEVVSFICTFFSENFVSVCRFLTDMFSKAAAAGKPLLFAGGFAGLGIAGMFAFRQINVGGVPQVVQYNVNPGALQFTFRQFADADNDEVRSTILKSVMLSPLDDFSKVEQGPGTPNTVHTNDKCVVCYDELSSHSTQVVYRHREKNAHGGYTYHILTGSDCYIDFLANFSLLKFVKAQLRQNRLDDSAILTEAFVLDMLETQSITCPMGCAPVDKVYKITTSDNTTTTSADTTTSDDMV